VSLDIKNTGGVKGAEAAQIYIKDVVCSVPRPGKELKAFSKIELLPEEKKTITMVLSLDAFAYFSTLKGQFVVDAGDFDVMAGASSADIRLTSTINIPNSYIISRIDHKPSGIDKYSIYPVPANKSVIFTFPDNGPLPLIEIFDINGRKMDRFQAESSNEVYNCGGLSNGIYFCRFITGSAVNSKRFIVDR